MKALTTHATNFVLAAAAVAAMAAALAMPGQAGAAPTDEPWPEQPSCSNETFTCTSMEDLVAYECYMESEDSPFNFCDDPFAELVERSTNKFAAPQSDPDPTPARLAIPATRR